MTRRETEPREKNATRPIVPLAIEYRQIDSLQLNAKNPRQHSPKQIAQIAASIEAFGFNIPIIVDPQGKIIAGHGRVLACKRLGWTEVPTIQLNHLTETQAKAFMIADNRLPENSVWDENLLALCLKELSLSDLNLHPDLNLEITGFEMGEIDLKIQSLDEADNGQNDPRDVLPDPGPPISRLGDLWILGRGRGYLPRP